MIHRRDAEDAEKNTSSSLSLRSLRLCGDLSLWPIALFVAAAQVITAIALWLVTSLGLAILIFGVLAAGLTLLAFLLVDRRVKDSARSINAHHAALMAEIELLKAQHGEQRIIHESMSTGMIALDARQHVLSVNRAAEQLLGIREETAKGKLLRDALQEPELNRFVSQAIGAARNVQAEFTLVGGARTSGRADTSGAGTSRGTTIHAIGEPLRAGDHKPSGLLLLLNDVTRIRRLEALRSDFAANVSHELRTPITNIKGYVETLLEVGVGDAEQTKRFLDIIHRNTERLAFIIEDLLSLARLEQPDYKGTLQRAPTPVGGPGGIIDAVLAQFETARAERDIEINVDVPPHSPHLQANVNAQLIEQALGNLLSNAIKYSPPHTKVTVRAAVTKQGEIELAVIDQGPGIAKEHLPRLFERFYRVDRARSREMGGTGLGLAIVKHIALVHGGRAEVQSEVGRGSEFKIVLPLTLTRANL